MDYIKVDTEELGYEDGFN